MFPLPVKIFPADPEALRAALEESLRRIVRPAGQMVTVEEKSYPELAAIRLSLDGAIAGEGSPPRPAPPVGPIEPGLRVADFEISGQPIFVQRAKVNLSCTARAVQLGQGRDRDGNVLLVLQDASEGKVEVGIALADLEALVLAGAQTEAARQGVTVEEVQIELGARGDRALDVVEIDEQLKARLSGLECAGEGPLGTLACGFIAPHLERFNDREFSLLALPLGEVKLRDVRVAAGNELRVRAEFGRV